MTGRHDKKTEEERRSITEALAHANGDLKKAARLVDLHYRTLLRRMHEYKLQVASRGRKKKPVRTL